MGEGIQLPGEVLKRELAGLSVSPSKLAHDIGVPPSRIGQIIAGKRSVTGDTALRFGHWFGVSPEYWMNLQSRYELALAEERPGWAIRTLPTAADRNNTSANRRYRHRGEIHASLEPIKRYTLTVETVMWPENFV